MLNLHKCYIRYQNLQRCKDIITAIYSCGIFSKSPLRLKRVDASRRMDDMIEIRRIKAILKSSDGDGIKCVLSVSFTAFNENYEVVKDAIINDDGQGAIDYKRDVSTGLSNGMIPSTNYCGSLNPLRWLDESDDSKGLEESVGSIQMEEV